MKPVRAYRPSVQPLEGRAVLSFSFSNLLHSVLPFIPAKSSPAPHVSPQVRAAYAARRATEVAANAHLAAHRSAVVAPRSVSRYGLSVLNDPAPGTVPVYGPYLAPTRAYHHKPPLVARPLA